MAKEFGTFTKVGWVVEHYNGPGSTYSGWHESNPDCFPLSKIPIYDLDTGFRSLEDAKAGIDIIRTYEFLQQTGPYKYEVKLAFDGKPLRLVKITKTITREKVDY